MARGRNHEDVNHEDVIVEIAADSDLGKVLVSAGNNSVAIISNERRHVVSLDSDDLWADYDPGAVREALRAAAGTLTEEEGERRKQDIYRWREEGSRPMHMITATRAAGDEVWTRHGALPAASTRQSHLEEKNGDPDA